MDMNFVSGKQVRVGDSIKFNYRGPLFQIHEGAAGGDNDGDGFVDDPTGGNPTVFRAWAIMPARGLFPWGTTPSNPMPYQIFRQPVKLSFTPLQLPESAVIDLFNSGVGNPGTGSGRFGDIVVTLSDGSTTQTFMQNTQPLVIMFSPSGALEKFYRMGAFEPISDPVYLLVGKREKVSPQPYDKNNSQRDVQSETHNFRDLENLWVSINPQTGLVSTAEMAEFDDSIVLGSNPDEHAQDALRRARQFATSAQTMGGR